MTELDYYRVWLNDITPVYSDTPITVSLGRTTAELTYYQSWLL